MTPARFQEITRRYSQLSIVVLGDFCLDRYLEIDPSREETSIETGLGVLNVARVRAQPGGAGTVLGNLVALRVGQVVPVGFCGEDGEGFELMRGMQDLPGVRMQHFVMTPFRHTFTYCKPLVIEPGKPPRELNRLDTKNWTPTPARVASQLAGRLDAAVERVDALVIVEQVDVAETGVLTKDMLAAVGRLAAERPQLRILADSRRGLGAYPPVCWKMNRAELGRLRGEGPPATVEQARREALELSARNGREVFVTLAEDGILAAAPDGQAFHAPRFRSAARSTSWGRATR